MTLWTADLQLDRPAFWADEETTERTLEEMAALADGKLLTAARVAAVAVMEKHGHPEGVDIADLEEAAERGPACALLRVTADFVAGLSRAERRWAGPRKRYSLAKRQRVKRWLFQEINQLRRDDHADRAVGMLRVAAFLAELTEKKFMGPDALRDVLESTSAEEEEQTKRRLEETVRAAE